METASLRTSSRAVKIISLLSVGKDVRSILTLNWVSSCMIHSEASKGEASTRSRIAVVVALPGVDEFSVAIVAATLRRALLAQRVGINGVWVFVGRYWPPLRIPLRPRLREAPGVRNIAGLRGVREISSSTMLSFCVIVGMDARLSCCGTMRMDSVTVGLRGCTVGSSG